MIGKNIWKEKNLWWFILDISDHIL